MQNDCDAKAIYPVRTAILSQPSLPPISSFKKTEGQRACPSVNVRYIPELFFRNRFSVIVSD